MNVLDVVIIGLVGVCFIHGAFRGLIKEVSSIIGIVAGFYAAFRYYPLLADLISPWFAEANIARLLSFVLIFLGIFFLVTLLGVFIRKGLAVASLGWVDQAAGFVFGFLKGILLVAVLLFALTSFLPAESRLLKDSRLAPHTMQIAEGLVKLIPADLKTEFHDRLKSLKDYWRMAA